MKISRKKRLALSVLFALFTLYLIAESVLFWLYYGLNDNGDPVPPLYELYIWVSIFVALALFSAYLAVKNFKKFKTQSKSKPKS